MAQKKPRELIPLEEVKRWLRRALIRRRQAIPLSKRKSWSKAAVKHLINTPEYRKAKTVALFLGFSSEIMTESLVKHSWEKGKNVLIPITSRGLHRPFFALFKKGDTLTRTRFGPMELTKAKKPFNFRSVDLVVVPGLGFDDRGHRLGYGGGVYDRILEKTPRAKHVGLFFSAQKIAAVPAAPHDVKMHMISTEKGLLP